MEQLLIVEDDRELNKGLCKALRSDGRQTVSCHSLLEARQQIGCVVPDLLLLDINLPDGSGLDFLGEVKAKFAQLPVILLTANDTDAEIVEGLQKGADDYITKPFSLAVLRARIDTQMRRRRPERQAWGEGDQKGVAGVQADIVGMQAGVAGGRAGVAGVQAGAGTAGGRAGADNVVQNGFLVARNPEVFSMDGYFLDFRQMLFKVGDQVVELSKTEQKALRILVENKGITVSRERMIDLIWTDGAEFVEGNALSVTVKRLRDKLKAGAYIKTVYGVGYTWEKHE